MRYLLTLIFFTGTIHFCNAQVSISNEKQNIVYIGVDNVMNVGVYNYDCKNIDVKVDAGDIKKAPDECGKYIYTAKEPGLVKFNVVGLKNDTVFHLDNIVYRVKYPPAPKAQIHIVLPGKNSYTGEDCCNELTVEGEKHVSVTKIKSIIGMGTVLKEFEYNVIYKIESFSYRIKRENKTIISGNNNGNKVDKDFINNMNLSLPGDTILFYNIFCKANFKDHIPLEDFEIYIDK